MAYVDFLSVIHKSTKRDYLARVNEYPKAEAMKIARRYDREYWDGDRKFGYGGYRYDGRWRKVARAMADHYGLKAGDRILDVGCGKGFLLHDFTLEVPGRRGGRDRHLRVRHRQRQGGGPPVPAGGRRAEAALPRQELRPRLLDQHAAQPLLLRHGRGGARRSSASGRRHKYIVVESFRNEEEQVNLMYWVLTGRCFFSPGGVGVVLQPRRLHRRPLLHLLRVSR